MFSAWHSARRGWFGSLLKASQNWGTGNVGYRYECTRVRDPVWLEISFKTLREEIEWYQRVGNDCGRCTGCLSESGPQFFCNNYEPYGNNFDVFIAHSR